MLAAKLRHSRKRRENWGHLPLARANHEWRGFFVQRLRGHSDGHRIRSNRVIAADVGCDDRRLARRSRRLRAHRVLAVLNRYNA